MAACLCCCELEFRESQQTAETLYQIKAKWLKNVYFKDMCRSLTCSLFFPNMIIKTRSGLEFPKIYKPRASKGVLPSHPNPRQRFKHLGLMTTPFWLLDFPSTPDHRNTVPKTCTEPHPSPFLAWGSAAALALYTEAALSTQNQRVTRGTALEHVITAMCPGAFLTKVWERCGEEKGAHCYGFCCLWPPSQCSASCLWIWQPELVTSNVLICELYPLSFVK